jgi:hypothetical protein
VRIGAPGRLSDVAGLRIGRRQGNSVRSAKLMELDCALHPFSSLDSHLNLV